VFSKFKSGTAARSPGLTPERRDWLGGAVKTLRLFSFLFAALAAFGEDLTTASGKVLRDATLTQAEADSVLVKHAGGEERVPLWELPTTVQARFKFDAVAALRRQAAEIARLKSELAAAQGATVQAQAALASAPKPRTPELWTNLPPTKPALELPALQDQEVVPVFDLVNHYRTDAASADARYRKKDFVIEGVIEQIDDRVFGHSVNVVLESPDRTMPVILRWRISDDYKKFYTKNAGRQFHAPANSKLPGIFLKTGQKVRFKVRGDGIDEGAINLTRVELLP
jgi:hypothetical protein